MHRRELFKRLVGIGAAKVALTTQTGDAASPERYRGYELVWTGWKQDIDRAILAAQWIASPKDHTRVGLAVVVPNFIGGIYYPGNTFNLTMYDHYVDPSTPPEIRRAYQNQGRTCLIALIDELWDFPDYRGGWGGRLDQPETWVQLREQLRAPETYAYYRMTWTGFKQVDG